MKNDMAPSQPHEHEQGIVMVCVTRQRTCERLIAHGETIAKEHQAPLHVVHAVKTGENFLGNAYESEALDYLFTAAQLCDGSLAVLRTDDVEGALRDYAKAHMAAYIVLGRSPAGSAETFESRMHRLLPAAKVIVV